MNMLGPMCSGGGAPTPTPQGSPARGPRRESRPECPVLGRSSGWRLVVSMGCSDSRAVSTISISAGPPRGEDEIQITELDGGPGSVMDADGVFYGGDGLDPSSHTLAQYLLDHMRKNAALDRVSQVDASTDESWSFRTLLTESVQVAEALAEQGLGPGDTVAFFSRNYHELYSAVMGCVLAGITASTMVPTHGPSELRFQLDLCEPKAIFVEAELLDRTLEALKDCSYEVEVIVLNSAEPHEGVTTYASVVERAFAADPDSYTPAAIEDNSTHVAFILYSSGTTGLPKGVQMSNAGLTSMVMNLDLVPDLPKTDCASILSLAPISWISGVILLLKSMELGHQRVFLADPKERSVLAAMRKYKVQLWPTAPSVLLALCSHPVARLLTFPSLRAILAGGAAMDAQAQTMVAKKLSCLVLQGYGSTEAGVVLAATYKRNKPGSLGEVQKFCHIRLVDLDTNEVVMEPGQVGEMRVKSPYTMLGYIKNPEATAECYDEDGWFQSGDLMYFDNDGFFFFVDRIKEMIKYKAYQVAPSELEAVLMTHPGVKGACVMGLPHPVDGELPAAFVVKSKSSVSEKDIQDFIAEKLSDPKKLRGGVIFIDSIPRTTTGKPMRGLLKKMLMDRCSHPEEE